MLGRLFRVEGSCCEGVTDATRRGQVRRSHVPAAQGLQSLDFRPRGAAARGLYPAPAAGEPHGGQRRCGDALVAMAHDVTETVGVRFPCLAGLDDLFV